MYCRPCIGPAPRSLSTSPNLTRAAAAAGQAIREANFGSSVRTEMRASFQLQLSWRVVACVHHNSLQFAAVWKVCCAGLYYSRVRVSVRCKGQPSAAQCSHCRPNWNRKLLKLMIGSLTFPFLFKHHFPVPGRSQLK